MNIASHIRNIAALLVLSCVALSAQPTLKVDSVASPSLGQTRVYGVLLPRDYDPARRYPILYLLHGHDGGYHDWTDRTKIIAFLDGWPLIVVFPDGDNSWYVNAAGGPNRRYEDYIVQDLLHSVEAKYSVDTTRRAIAGLSMGGYGALLYGCKHPDLFRFAGSLSGAFSLPHVLADTSGHPMSRTIGASLKAAFGEDPGRSVASNDVFALVAQPPRDSLPSFYLVAGIQDGFKDFLPAHRMLADALRGRNARYEYHETPGGHSWAFWDREIRPLLLRMREVIGF